MSSRDDIAKQTETPQYEDFLTGYYDGKLVGYDLALEEIIKKIEDFRADWWNEEQETYTEAEIDEKLTKLINDLKVNK